MELHRRDRNKDFRVEEEAVDDSGRVLPSSEKRRRCRLSLFCIRSIGRCVLFFSVHRLCAPSKRASGVRSFRSALPFYSSILIPITTAEVAMDALLHLLQQQLDAFSVRAVLLLLPLAHLLLLSPSSSFVGNAGASTSAPPSAESAETTSAAEAAGRQRGRPTLAARCSFFFVAAA